ncbi:NIF3 family metal-binding protein [Candidatus Kinetoplastibacterium oncopeltii TCC290E]|uniref:NIF3 family metal-binding protein n=1 Tax=Candidatus Kinetoplastidibacterium stringomonadis TCC290E TaxID=1208920 RepID=M1LVC6_9PROT|nr:Nif3-like dinuclear metal center hexameric protein [Candidatus Kinetoplastibacterium oncopeltii]AGF48046.1 NIF3 family metal-binding protein [Candidatus Kinetoplastibacterium oncopeltii TCC290E]
MEYITSQILLDWLNSLLDPEKYKDYCHNGLQIEGKEKIYSVALGVTACELFLQKAIAAKADAVIVHHGLLWANDNLSISGIKRKRIDLCLRNNLNVFAYHLPLDDHPEVGNNITLGSFLGFDNIRKNIKKGSMLWSGMLKNLYNMEHLNVVISDKLNRSSLLIGDPQKNIKNIVWCSGGGQKMFQEAIDIGADVYITGEISESVVHISRETNVGFICAGHHATERYGIQALGNALEKTFHIKVKYIEIENPI